MLGKLLPSLSSQARALLVAEQSRDEQDDSALKRRLLARAKAAVEQERPSGIGLRPSVVTNSVRRRSFRTVAVMAAAIGVAGFAAAATSLWQAREARTVLPVQTPAPQTAAAGIAIGGALPLGTASAAVAPELLRSARPSSNAAPPTERPRPSTVQQYKLELLLLEPARSKIAQGDYSGSLAAITNHQRDFPSGLLAEEREALRVRALWGMGQLPAAEAAAKAFRARFPRSSLLSWMKKADSSAP